MTFTWKLVALSSAATVCFCYGAAFELAELAHSFGGTSQGLVSVLGFVVLFFLVYSVGEDKKARSREMNEARIAGYREAIRVNNLLEEELEDK